VLASQPVVAPVPPAPVPPAPVAAPVAPAPAAPVPAPIPQDAPVPAPQDAPSAPPASAPPAPAAPASDEGTLLLIFDTGQREQLPSPVAVNLGRNPAPTEPGDHTIAVQDPESTVSKTHLRLEHAGGRTFVTDLGSTNGTDLLEEDGDVVRLTAGERTLVDEGTRVRVGNRAFTISLLLGGQRTA
jgi:pSer/pThr/pTyr-binding forkhead associated (FHA) protein